MRNRSFPIILCLLGVICLSSCSGTNILKADRQVSAVVTLLSEKNIAQLESASMVREFVFPFDFLQEPFPTSGSEWAQLRKDVELATGERSATLVEQIWGVNADSAAPLTPSVHANWAFYQKLHEKGIDLARYDDFYFLVIASASAGFDLNDLKIVSGNQLELPAAKVLNLNVTTEMRAGWPNISGMTPALLKDVIDFVTPFVEAEID